MKSMLAFVALVVVAAVPAAPAYAGGGCHQFFTAHKQSVIVPSYQQVAQLVAPFVLYQVGRDLEYEIIADKVAQKLRAEGLTAPAPTSAPLTRPTSALLMKKCGSCHGGPTPKGGLVLDGSAWVPDRAVRRFFEMASQNKDVPTAMKTVIANLTLEEKGGVADELLNLPEPVAAAPAATP